MLTWAVYRLNRQYLSLRERVQRQGKRTNEVLYRVTRDEKGAAKNKPAKKGKSPVVGLREELENDAEVICAKCGRRYPRALNKCPYCDRFRRDADRNI